MKIRLRYFGMLAEVMQKNETEIRFENPLSVADLKKKCLNENPELKTYDFRVAVNHEIRDDHFVISSDAEVAFLPPFAGG